MSKSPAANKQAEMKLEEADKQMKEADKLWVQQLYYIFSLLFIVVLLEQPKHWRGGSLIGMALLCYMRKQVYIFYVKITAISQYMKIRNR